MYNIPQCIYISLTNEKCLVHAPLGDIGSFLSACQNPGRQGRPVAPSCPTVKKVTNIY